MRRSNLIFVPLLFRFLWQWYPSLWACALFWFAVLVVEVWTIRNGDQKLTWRSIPIFAGAGMNATVTLANGGRMPFLGHYPPSSIWVVGTGKHLLFLCDRFRGFSLGDFFIIGGILLPILPWLFQRFRKSENPLNSAISDSK